MNRLHEALHPGPSPHSDRFQHGVISGSTSRAASQPALISWCQSQLRDSRALSNQTLRPAAASRACRASARARSSEA